jgi:hypothetical protein
MFYWWLTVMMLFVIVVGYGNRHPWYQLPLVPIAAAFAGCSMMRLCSTLQLQRWMRIFAAVVILGLFARQSYSATRLLYQHAAVNLWKLGLALKVRTPSGSLIIVADYGDPTALYYGERKGWHFTEKEAIYNGHPITSADAISDLEHLRKKGATHIAFYSESFWWLDYYRDFADHLRRTSVPVEVNPNYQIFELKRRD